MTTQHQPRESGEAISEDEISQRVKALFQPWPKDEMGPSDEPESQYRLGYNTALEDALGVITDQPVAAVTSDGDLRRTSGEALSDELYDMQQHEIEQAQEDAQFIDWTNPENVDSVLDRIMPLLAQRAETDGDAKDAARYRKLRAQQWQTSHLFVVRGSRDAVRLGTYCPSFELLDEEVDALPDAAMGGETK